ncbi:hypothetical protein CAL18_06185 [Bordetella genomosp. 7]|uniref:outer membrane protein assembly factor BamE n=1 Tax=Bordetella genomosp. 7 TaxID=1416805 RepID=UPI000B9EE5C4|nr:outer membrane protein assembly factor BamE [Bordetella genomosp. 7]OZI27122.1 hypothetical protein CAL18_06185 [Bordetella genomosp. 7]
MKTATTPRTAWLACGAAAVLLAGCGTLSNVSRDGTTQQPVFPDRAKVALESGTYPNLQNLAQLQPGATRDQVYDLVGRPHFAEGFQVREWDYLFHFHTPQGVRTCQFKVLFDDDKIARSFYWAPDDCRPTGAAARLSSQNFTLGSDVSFGFGGATLAPAGQTRIAEIATGLRRAGTVER